MSAACQDTRHSRRNDAQPTLLARERGRRSPGFHVLPVQFKLQHVTATVVLGFLAAELLCKAHATRHRPPSPNVRRVCIQHQHITAVATTTVTVFAVLARPCKRERDRGALVWARDPAGELQDVAIRDASFAIRIHGCLGALAEGTYCVSAGGL